MKKRQTAVVLFNLGGPSSPDEIQPFLYSLFSDPAILTVPQPFRFFLALLITRRRLKEAQHIYGQLGGSSPLLKNTQAQAEALEKALNELPLRGEGPLTRPSDDLSHKGRGIPTDATACAPDEHRYLIRGKDTSPLVGEVGLLLAERSKRTGEGYTNLYKTFVAMRHATPRIDQTFQEIQKYGPDEIVLLPLYPHYSTTTTESALKEWKRVSRVTPIPTQFIYSYPAQNGFIEAMKELTLPLYKKAKEWGAPRVLLTAHGLPEKIIKKGDPYQNHVEESAQAFINVLQIPADEAVLCYQSRVGPLKWIGPSTEDEIIKASQERRPLVIVPISFVSEHSETLVELDITYKKLALDHGCPAYYRVETVQTHPLFIRGLADLVREYCRVEENI